MPRGTKVTVLQAGWLVTARQHGGGRSRTGTGTGKSCFPQGPASHRKVAIRFRGRA